jgi:phosphoribosylanthranilate isomerase
MTPWVKICGTTNFEDTESAWSVGADAIGFVFVDHSARRVPPHQVREIVDRLARPVERIGVVQNQSVPELVALFERCGLSGLQLQGEETPEMLSELRSKLPDARIIKGVHVQSTDDLRRKVDLYQGCGADNLLLDAYVSGQSGGTGTTFDWAAAVGALQHSRNRLPIIIAGGLNAKNVADAIATFHPFGVDVVSGVELTKGKKDPAKIRDFISAANAAVGREVTI